MKLSFVLQLAVFSTLHHFGQASPTKCNHDNCLRALNPTGRPDQTAAVHNASAFCAAYTFKITTLVPRFTPPAFPTFATSACGTTDYDRYSSACSCAFPSTPITTPVHPTTPPISTLITTPTTHPITSVPTSEPDVDRCVEHNAVVNGGFEAGQSAPPEGWSFAVNQSNGAIQAPYSTNGFAANLGQFFPYKGKYAARIIAKDNAPKFETFDNVRLYQYVNVIPDATNKLEFRFYFPHNAANETFNEGGNFYVRIDGQTVVNTTSVETGFDFWARRSIDFTPRPGANEVLIEFVANVQEFVDGVRQGPPYKVLNVFVDAVFVPRTLGAINLCP